ncbi:hypothetical protein ABK040_005262 [Willaertia magna]
MLNNNITENHLPSPAYNNDIKNNDDIYSELIQNDITLNSEENYVRKNYDILNMFKEAKQNNTYLKIQAPMVRYSKLAFRNLCLEYGCDIVYTPMIMSDSFSKSQKARDSDFSTNNRDGPLVVQFAANKPTDFSISAQYLAKYCDGFDLNCGCPQPKVIHAKLGASLVLKPQLIFDIVHQTNNQLVDHWKPIGVKIRLNPEDDEKFEKTIDLVRQIQKAGASWITIHGRTQKQRTRNTKVNVDAVKLLRQYVDIPCVHNGDVFSLEDANHFFDETKCDGVMAARGLLANPALFNGHKQVPWECIKRYIQIAIEIGGTPYHILHNHIMFMLYSNHQFLSNDLIEFTECSGVASMLDYFESRGLSIY